MLLFASMNAFGQIDMKDSTVQVIGYWDRNEKQSYEIRHEKYKIQQADTLGREFSKYKVDITILDSTENCYIIDWYYHDYEFKTNNEILQKLAAITEEMHVQIKTNELGIVEEVLNWEEIRDLIYKGTHLIKKETKSIPNLSKLINQVEQMYSTKESIEAVAIKDIQQFYTYHGAKYKLGEQITGGLQVPNLLGGKPFDTEVTLWLDEIVPEDNNFVIQMRQNVNSVQLTQATFDYMTKMSETMEIAKPTWESFQPLTNETRIASRIHGSGWVLFSVETKEVAAENTLQVEERIVEIL